MWKQRNAQQLLTHAVQTIALRRSSSVSCAVNSSILRSLKDHFLDASRASPPPKMEPPEPFTVVKGAMAGINAPVLRRSYGGEQISISAVRFHGGVGEDDDIGELLLRVEVSKAAEEESLHFVCSLYPDAIGIDSVFMAPRDGSPVPSPMAYSGPPFRDLDEKMRDMFHKYIEERGINESLFPFLQVWLYVKDHRKFVRWLKSVGTFIKDKKSSEEA